MRLTVKISAPTLPPNQMPAGEVGVIPTREGVELRIKVTGASVSVRPWRYRDGDWEPCRYDAKTGVGIEPVTADPTLNGGRANGLYLVGPGACAFCLVAESGDANNVVEASLQEYFVG